VPCNGGKITDSHIHNVQYLLLFHDKHSYVNASRCYITRTLPVLLVMTPSVLYVGTCVSLEKVPTSSGLKELPADTFCSVHIELKPTSCTTVFFIFSIYTSFGAEPFVFQVAIQKFKDQDI